MSKEMHNTKFIPILFLFVLTLSGCSMLGKSNVEIAPYNVLEKENNIELRHYDSLILVSTSMSEGMEEQGSPFYKLFDYISGENQDARQIPMTAPVFMDQAGMKTEKMSFVLPATFKINDAPQPKDPSVQLEEIKDYTVAAIVFSGFLNQENINEHKAILREWIKNKGYKPTGEVRAAGYNPPFTVPALRRNEVLISVE